MTWGLFKINIESSPAGNDRITHKRQSLMGGLAYLVLHILVRRRYDPRALCLTSRRLKVVTQ